MSLNKEAHLRYKIIDSCIGNKNKPFPSMNYLIESLEGKLGKTFTVSTIQKDIKSMKEDDVLGFSAPIKYSKSNEGYYYSDADYSISKLPLTVDESNTFLETMDLLEIIAEKSISDEAKGAYIKLKNHLSLNKHQTKSIIPYVVSQRAPQQWGFFHYKALLEHIKRKEPFTMIYYSLKENEMVEETTHPYQLLEFDARWYLLGYSESKKRLRVYGLERIMPDWDVNKKITFKESKRKEVVKYSKNMYGVYPLYEAKKQLIKFYVSKSYEYILEMNPLHSSQKIVDRNHELITLITVELIPTHELIRWFLANCENVMVDTDNIKDIIKDIARDRFERNKIKLKQFK